MSLPFHFARLSQREALAEDKMLKGVKYRVGNYKDTK